MSTLNPADPEGYEQQEMANVQVDEERINLITRNTGT